MRLSSGDAGRSGVGVSQDYGYQSALLAASLRESAGRRAPGCCPPFSYHPLARRLNATTELYRGWAFLKLLTGTNKGWPEGPTRVSSKSALRDDLGIADQPELHADLAAGLHRLEEELDYPHVQRLELVDVDYDLDEGESTASAN